MFGNNYDKKLAAENWTLKKENEALKSRLSAESVIASFDLLESIRKVNPGGETELRVSVNNDQIFKIGIYLTRGRFGMPTYTEQKFDSFQISDINASEAKRIESKLVREMMKQFYKYIKGE